MWTFLPDCCCSCNLILSRLVLFHFPLNISNSECIHRRIPFLRGIMVLMMESVNLHWQVIPLQTCDIHVWTVVFLRGKYVLSLYFLLRHVVDGWHTSWPVQLYLNHFSATLNNPSIPAAPVAWPVCGISCGKKLRNRCNFKQAVVQCS